MTDDATFDGLEPEARERMLGNGANLFGNELDAFMSHLPDEAKLGAAGVPVELLFSRGSLDLFTRTEIVAWLEHRFGVQRRFVSGHHAPYLNQPEVFARGAAAAPSLALSAPLAGSEPSAGEQLVDRHAADRRVEELDRMEGRQRPALAAQAERSPGRDSRDSRWHRRPPRSRERWPPCGRRARRPPAAARGCRSRHCHSKAPARQARSTSRPGMAPSTVRAAHRAPLRVEEMARILERKPEAAAGGAR